MILLLDFDHTLFDSGRFRKSLCFETIDHNFLPSRAMSILRLLFFRYNLAQFLFPDTLHFLENHAEHHRVLITYGNKIFQRLKVAKSGLMSYFDEMIYTGSIMKGDIAYSKFVDRGKDPIVFLDDRVAQLASMKARCPHIIAVRIKRREGILLDETTPAGCHEVTDLAGFAVLLRSLEQKD